MLLSNLKKEELLLTLLQLQGLKDKRDKLFMQIPKRAIIGKMHCLIILECCFFKGMTLQIARDLGKFGIRVVTIAP